jgi:methylase of polypeptide subunit release factors
VQIFEQYILQEIHDILHEYIWVDLFAGAGNLVLPILQHIPQGERIEFFEKHIYLFDTQIELVEQAIANAVNYGIPQDIAKQHILQRDTIRDYPTFLLELG